MANNTGKQQGRGCIVTPDMVYSEHEQWFKEYDDGLEALNHNEQLLQQRYEGRKMAYEPKDNTLNIFKNKFKNKENDPDFTGDALVGGKHWRALAWKNKDKNGNTYLGIKFKPPQESAQKFPTVSDVSKVEDDPF